jgi:hypothetical protein
MGTDIPCPPITNMVGFGDDIEDTFYDEILKIAV